MQSPTNVLRAPPHITALLARLHHESAAQEASIDPQHLTSLQAGIARDPATGFPAFDDLMRDKFIALDADKAAFIYQLMLAARASYVVEAGTSFGVSTIWWALAVAETERVTGRKGVVVGTEKEVGKADVARGYWRECGEVVERRIDLRVGDLEETLKSGVEDVDFLVLDIWPPAAITAFKVILPRLKPGAIVVVDNSITSGPRPGYVELLIVLRDPDGDFRTSTLPFKGGLEVAVYAPRTKA